MLTELFQDTPFKSTPNLTGMNVAQDGTLILGSRAGPQVSPENLAHEMAHLVEIPIGRLGKVGWGLRTPKRYIMGRLVCETVTHQMTDREIRVIAYQANILADRSLPFDLEYTCRSLGYLPDWFNVPMEDGRQGYEAQWGTVKEIELSRLKWILNQVQDARKIYTAEKFYHEWWRRAKFYKRKIKEINEHSISDERGH